MFPVHNHLAWGRHHKGWHHWRRCLPVQLRSWAVNAILGGLETIRLELLIVLPSVILGLVLSTARIARPSFGSFACHGCYSQTWITAVPIVEAVWAAVNVRWESVVV